MDQLPRGNEGFANNDLFSDSQQFNAYDNLFQTGADQTSYDASWGVNASNQAFQSRAQHPPASNWSQNANHLSAPPAHGNINSQVSPYARPLSHSPAAYGQNVFSGYSTPQTFQYRQAQYDPALVGPPHAFNQNLHYSTTDYQIPNAATIAPHALQHDAHPTNFGHNPYDASQFQVNNLSQARLAKPSTPVFVDEAKLISSIPSGTNGGRFSIINFDELGKATNSERMGSFLNIGKEAYNWNLNRAALPNYVRRKSRNELRKLAGNDAKLLAKLGKKNLKKDRMLAAGTKTQSNVMKTSVPAADKIKYEDDSSSEESSSDPDDESSYSSDVDSEPSPLPAKRPATPKESTEYDTIKALWRSKRKNLDSDSIRDGLKNFWEIVKTVRDRWKIDVAAVQDAEKKNHKNELPLLESRVKDQRDLLETAFKAALKHGHRALLELMSENLSLLYLIYQFLLDRSKVDDHNGPLSRAMLEMLSLSTTLNDEKLEKTHLIKVIPRYIKKGDAKTQYYAKRVTASAAAGLKTEESAKKTTTTKGNSAASPAAKRTEPEAVAGVKRPASAHGEATAQKKVATVANKTNGVAVTGKQSLPVKKSLSTTAGAKPATGATATVAKPKQVVAKPSGLFSSLQSAGKKPGTSTASKAAQSAIAAAGSKPADRTSNSTVSTNQSSAPKSTFSFAETMANLSKTKEERPAPKPEKKTPVETPEETAKRLRKESRRHLHVSFKTGEDLVQVREFHHDPEEELGHDANQVRDLADVGGEGRMFKQQHHMKDIDDEDEEEQKLVDFSSPSAIDFSAISSDEREKNYLKFGGSKLEPVSPERAERERHEANTLIVYYSNASDIPPNPREPADPDNGEPVGSVTPFGTPDEKYMWRASKKKVGSHAHQLPAQYNTPNSAAPSFLSSFVNNYQPPPPSNYQPPAQPAAPSQNQINSLLASLQQAANKSTPPLPNMGGYSAPSHPAPSSNLMFPGFPPPPPQQPAPQSNGQPDLAAILAQLQGTAPTPSQPPPMATYGNYSAPPSVPTTTTWQPPTTMYENPERRQLREGGADNVSNTRRQNTGHNPYYRTKVCRYWQEGRCQKGDQCSYKHDDS